MQILNIIFLQSLFYIPLFSIYEKFFELTSELEIFFDVNSKMLPSYYPIASYVKSYVTVKHENVVKGCPNLFTIIVFLASIHEK